MKLRWVEREVFVPEKGLVDIGTQTKVKVLQYWEIPNTGYNNEYWNDVPTEVEEV